MSMYKVLSSIPVPTAAHFLVHTTDARYKGLEVTYSIADHVRDIKRTTTKTIFFSSSDKDMLVSMAGQDISTAGIVKSTWSLSTKYKAVLRNLDGGKKRFVEIWRRDGALILIKDVTDDHGEFYADEYFGGLSFSPSEDAIIYVAEANAPKDVSKFAYSPSFGEGLTSKKRPTPFMLRILGNNEASLSALVTPAVDKTVSFGQFVFQDCPDSGLQGTTMLATGYQRTSDDRTLGLLGCFNRPAAIWKLTLDGPLDNTGTPISLTVEQLTSSSISCRSPRVSPNGSAVFISNALGGAHAGSTGLHLLGQSEPIVKTVWDPKDSNEFPGLFLGASLPTYPFVENGSWIVTHTTWGSRSRIVAISTTNSTISDITPTGKDYSYTILATDKSHIAAVRSSLVSVPELILGTMTEMSKAAMEVEWRTLEAQEVSTDVSEALSKLTMEIIKTPERHPTESIVLRHRQSTDESRNPLITMPHGGPHATWATSWTPATTALALEGFTFPVHHTISLPNYTGSLGYGERYVQALRGHCGTLDVEDCVASVRHLIALGIAEEGEGKLFISGGSHGGFLGAHFVARFPTLFTAAVLRNPVISAGDVWGTDIPEWYFEEFNFPFFPKNASERVPYTITSDQYTALQAASPISYVQDVQASVLILLGASDNRVNPKQGLGFYHALKGRIPGSNEEVARGKGKVDLMWFEGEGHPIEGVEAARVAWESTRDWFANVRA
ncbi:alpha/beta-hydrolase [Hymenopellis radicata]|nr:alpha/beta-hydrolase [Hymenopellis radicata]